MLVLLVYNFLGYYIVFYFQHREVKEDFAEYINQGQYTDADLKLFKVPINIYAQATSSDFSRVEGDFEHNGKFYEIIKQQILNDTIYTYCLNNEKEEQLLARLYDHIQNQGLDTKSSKSKNDNPFKNLLKEYLQKNNTNFASIMVSYIKVETATKYKINFSFIYPSIPNPPPELV